MSHLLFLIPLPIGMGLVGFGAFVWALRNGQFEDPEGNARRVLTPQEPPQWKGTRHERSAAQAHDGHAPDRRPARREDAAHDGEDDPA